MINSAAARVLLSAARSVTQKRCSSAVATPPHTHVSEAEKITLGIILCGSMLVIPGWVLANIKHYRAEK